MIARLPTLVVLGVVAVAAVCAALPSGTMKTGPLPSLAGALPPAATKASASADVGDAAEVLAVGVDPAAMILLKNVREATVRFVPVEASSFTLTMHGASVRPTGQDIAQRKRKAVKTLVAAKVPEPPAAPSPVVAAAAVAPPVPPPPPVVAPTPPTPTLPATFTEIDEALRASPTTKTINVRQEERGVTFRLTHVGRIAEHYVLRFAIANTESSDFFLSIVNVTAGGKPIHSETAGPYVAPAGQEVYGVVHFAPADAAGKNISVELIQSGGDRRHFPLSVSYAF